MMCSPQELGLPDPIEGLLILREDAQVGQSFAEYLGRAGGDVVYDLEITPNRPDFNSVIGIAREISALTGNPLRLPPVFGEPSSRVGVSPALDFSPPIENPVKAADLVGVRLADPALCPRYTARVVRGVKIGPSPDWCRAPWKRSASAASPTWWM